MAVCFLLVEIETLLLYNTAMLFEKTRKCSAAEEALRTNELDCPSDGEAALGNRGEQAT